MRALTGSNQLEKPGTNITKPAGGLHRREHFIAHVMKTNYTIRKVEGWLELINLSNLSVGVLHLYSRANGGAETESDLSPCELTDNRCKPDPFLCSCRVPKLVRV